MNEQIITTKDEAIEAMLNKFDFNKVQFVMKSLNWEWHNKGIPTIEDLKECAKDLLNTAYEEKIIQTSTGGFVASYDSKGQMKYLNLYFKLTNSSIFY